MQSVVWHVRQALPWDPIFVASVALFIWLFSVELLLTWSLACWCSLSGQSLWHHSSRLLTAFFHCSCVSSALAFWSIIECGREYILIEASLFYFLFRWVPKCLPQRTGHYFLCIWKVSRRHLYASIVPGKTPIVRKFMWMGISVIFSAGWFSLLIARVLWPLKLRHIDNRRRTEIQWTMEENTAQKRTKTNTNKKA